MAHRDGNNSITGLIREARRRHVFRVAAIYVVGGWLVLQIADVLLPGFGVPDTAIAVLLLAAVLGFPVALIFGWLFDIDRSGIHRTLPATASEQREPLRLQRKDYVILAALAAVMSIILLNAISNVARLPRQDEQRTAFESAPVDRLANSIAVLPFANISADPDNAYFCDGISEDIRGRLAQFGELNVIGRTSSEAFRGRSLPVTELAALLGVRYVLDGSVQKAGTQLRITASLLDASGVQVWSNRFDRQLQDVFSIQAEIADTVATTVYPKVVPVGAQHDSPTLSAFDHFLRGRELLHQRDRAGAIEELARAIELEPGYPEALAEYGIALTIGYPSDAEVELARQVIDKALELRPGMPRALAGKGLLIASTSDDAARAETYLRQALEKDPSMSDASNWLSGVLSQQGQEEQASEVMRRAFEMDPLHPAIVANYSSDLYAAGDNELARQILWRLIEANPASHVPYGVLVDDFRREGRLVDMLQVAQLAALNGASIDYWTLARAYALLGDYESAEYWAERTQRDFPGWIGTPYVVANLLIWQGKYEEAVAAFETSMQERGLVLEEQHVWVTQYLGWLESLAGMHRRAIETLESVPIAKHSSAIYLDAQQGLAWAYLQTDQRHKALALLEQLDEFFAQQERQGVLASLDTPLNQGPYLYALNARILGDDERALDLLEQAVDSGWRSYYICHHDPRWDALRDNPRFRRIMGTVKADVDAQRAELERSEGPGDFAERLNRVLAGEAAGD